MRIVIINGAGGSGKDTCVELIKSYVRNQYEVKNLSTITKVKEIACDMGWNYEKDDRGRAFLADLKRVWKTYNNGPFKEITRQIGELNLFEEITGKECLIFIHCREREEINEFKEWCENRGIDCQTLFIKRDGIQRFYNSADSNVEFYNYDYTIINDGSIEVLEKKCQKWIENKLWK